MANRGERKTLVLAAGDYHAVSISGGVKLYGGYASDFSRRDVREFPSKVHVREIRNNETWLNGVVLTSHDFTMSDVATIANSVFTGSCNDQPFDDANPASVQCATVHLRGGNDANRVIGSLFRAPATIDLGSERPWSYRNVYVEFNTFAASLTVDGMAVDPRGRPAAGQYTNTTWGTNLVGTPSTAVFRNAAGGDFRLTKQSDCTVARGVNLATLVPLVDSYGTPRTPQYSIGAFEWDGDCQ